MVAPHKPDEQIGEDPVHINRPSGILGCLEVLAAVVKRESGGRITTDQFVAHIKSLEEGGFITVDDYGVDVTAEGIRELGRGPPSERC